MKIKIFMVVLLGLLLPWTSFAQAEDGTIAIVSPADAKIKRVLVTQGDFVYSGDEIATLKAEDGAVIVLRAGQAGKLTELLVTEYQKLKPPGYSLNNLQLLRIQLYRPSLNFLEISTRPQGFTGSLTANSIRTGQ